MSFNGDGLLKNNDNVNWKVYSMTKSSPLYVNLESMFDMHSEYFGYQKVCPKVD
jgi:hypothetical protein